MIVSRRGPSRSGWRPFLQGLVVGAVVWSGPAAAQPSSSLRIVENAEPRSLDIVVDRAKPSQRIAAAILERLVTLDENMKMHPGLATSWEQLDDLTWRFKLRPDVRFHNGEPFNAEAVRFSLHRIKSGGTAGAYLNVVSDAIPVDDLTVDIKTSSKTSAAPMLMTQLWLYPPKYFAQVGQDAFGRSPVGTGAFQFESWNIGRTITFKRNPSYWGDKAKLESISWQWAVEGSARSALLNAGNVDIAMNVPPQDVARVKSGADTKLASVATVRTVFLIFNTEAEFVRDKKVREAIVRSIDRKSLIEAVLGEAGDATPSIYPRALDLAEPGRAPGFAFDPAKAAALLRDIGAARTASLDFHSSTGRHPLEPELAEAISGMLEGAGFKVSRNAREPGAHQTLFYSQKISGMFLVSNGMTYPHPDQILRVFFHSKALLRYCNTPELDKRVDEALAFTGTAAKEAYVAIERTILEDLVCGMPLYNTVDFHGLRKSVQGLRPGVDEYINFALLHHL